MQCNCENLHCPVCQGRGCKEPAGAMRAMYVGAMCDGCAQHMPKQYLLTEVSPGVYEDGHVSDTAVECPDCGSTAHDVCGEG